MRSALFDALDSLKPHTILGHSLGGWLGGAYGIACGQGVRPTEHGKKSDYQGPQQLILFNPSGAFPSASVRAEFESKFRIAVEEGFELLRPHVFGREPFWFRYVAREFAQFIRQDDVRQFMLSVRDDHLLEAGLSAVKARVWLVWGEDDSLVPASCARTWIEKLAAPADRPARALMLKGTGHSPQIERPGITAAALAQILSDQVPHAAGRRWWRVEV